MQQWQQVLIDIGVLAFFALLYYLYQKNRILYYSEQEFFQELDSFLGNLEDFVENNHQGENTSQYHEFITKLTPFLNKVPNKDEFKIDLPPDLPTDFKNHFQHILKLLEQ